MKICPQCSRRHEAPDWKCPFCSFEPDRTETHVRLAPNVDAQTVGFEPEFFEDLFVHEAGSFWFRARNRIIQWAIAKYFHNARSLLEIGCGTGFVLAGLRQKAPQLVLSGTEVLDRGLELAAARLSGVILYQLDAQSLPFENEFDVIGAFDVLEHIGDDSIVFSEMYRAAKPGGGILVTVPQHRWLWSQADVHAQHQRRYERADIVGKVKAAGFQVTRITSFVSLLLPMMLASRRLKPQATYNPRAEFDIPAYQNAILETVMDMERSLIRAGFDFPSGGSLMLVAHKR